METQQERYTFATWNIDQDMREERCEQTKVDVRWPRILEQIKDCRPDILCLQELRNLTTSVVTVPRALYEVSQLGYDYKHAYYGPDRMAFAMAIFFRREKFFPTQLHLQLLPPGKIFLGVQLRCITSAKQLTVYSTHFGLDEAEKTRACEYLCDWLDERREAYLCAGDYNFFDDLDGSAQRQRMLHHNLRQDLAHPLSNASGTFMGYESNEFKQPYDKMSRLDHVFASTASIKRCGEARAWGDMEQVRQRTYPSDHLMIYLEFEL